MQSVKPLLLLLLTYSLLSCAPTNPAPTRMGDEKTTDCGEIPIGVTIDKRELDIAGATMAGFSLGKLEVKDTPQFQKIISEAASNSAATDVLVCKAIARAGVRGDPEMVDYFTRMTHFFARQPSISEQLQWRQTNPFPSNSAARKPKDTSQNKAAIRQLVGEGYALKETMEGDYRFHRKQNTFSVNREELLKNWRQRVSGWEDTVAVALQQIDPIIRAQFRNYMGGSGVRWGENTDWSELDGALNSKLNFLIQLMNRL